MINQGSCFKKGFWSNFTPTELSSLKNQFHIYPLPSPRIFMCLLTHSNVMFPCACFAYLHYTYQHVFTRKDLVLVNPIDGYLTSVSKQCLKIKGIVDLPCMVDFWYQWFVNSEIKEFRINVIIYSSKGHYRNCGVGNPLPTIDLLCRVCDFLHFSAFLWIVQEIRYSFSNVILCYNMSYMKSDLIDILVILCIFSLFW